MFLFFWPTDQQRAQEQVLESLPMVSEVNAISEELNKHKYVQRNVDFTCNGPWAGLYLTPCLNSDLICLFCLCWEEEAPWPTRDTCTAMIYMYQCTSELQYILSWYKYRCYDKISQYNYDTMILCEWIKYSNCTLPFTYLLRWRHKSMPSSNKCSANTVLCARGQNTWLVHSPQLFFTCQLYVAMYWIVFHILTLVSRYVSFHEKLYRCWINRYSCFSHLRTFEVILISGAAQGGDSETK